MNFFAGNHRIMLNNIIMRNICLFKLFGIIPKLVLFQMAIKKGGNNK